MYYEFNGLHVAHGPFISSFDLSYRTLVKHTKFEEDIFKLFEKVALPALMNFGVILKNGHIYSDLREDPLRPEI